MGDEDMPGFARRIKSHDDAKREVDVWARSVGIDVFDGDRDIDVAAARITNTMASYFLRHNGDFVFSKNGKTATVEIKTSIDSCEFAAYLVYKAKSAVSSVFIIENGDFSSRYYPLEKTHPREFCWVKRWANYSDENQQFVRDCIEKAEDLGLIVRCLDDCSGSGTPWVNYDVDFVEIDWRELEFWFD